MKTIEIEYALFDWLYRKKHHKLTLTRYNYGIVELHHECDVLSVSNSGYLTEFEIKVSKSDLKADLKKRHNHNSKRLKYQYFAIPKELKECVELIPENFGIVIVSEDKYSDGSDYYRVKEIRKPKKNNARKISDEEFINLCRLSAMRFWSVKRKEINSMLDKKISS